MLVEGSKPVLVRMVLDSMVEDSILLEDSMRVVEVRSKDRDRSSSLLT